MTDTKTIGISSLITLGIVLASMVGVNYFDEPKYYCESESSIMECSELSSGSQTRCYLNDEKTSWDYCSSGWIEVTNDLIIEDIPNSKISDKIWICSIDGCEKL